MTSDEQVDQRLSRHQRLPASGIKDTFENGSNHVGRFMVLWLRQGEDADLRLGVCTGRRTLRRAVDRARARRMLREAYRLNRFRFKGEADVVLVARSRLLEATLDQIEKELLKLAERAGLL